MKNCYIKYSYKISNYLLSPTSLLYYKIPENKFLCHQNIRIFLINNFKQISYQKF